jgi:hypothetical protein
MAKPIVSRRRAQRMARQKTTSTPAAGNPIPALRKLQAALAEDLGPDFLSARSAVMTAILALEGKGVTTHIAASLRMHVLLPLDRIEKLATNRERS